MNRRDFTISCLGALAAVAAGHNALAATPSVAAADAAGQDTLRDAAATRPGKTDAAPGQDPIHIAFALFDGMTALDMIGPATVFGGNRFRVDYVWRDKNPVRSESASGGMILLPTATFDEVKAPDILCVPGTSNPYAPIREKDLVGWVAETGQKASWITSVCTGSFILGAAGLLKGYKATAHWTMLDDLAYFGATPTRERVVIDRNRVTGAGVTSGIDFGLTLYAMLIGEEAARAKQLTLEYDPEPPFRGGSPKTADAAMLDAARTGFAAYIDTVAPHARQTLEEAAQRLGVTVGQ